MRQKRRVEASPFSGLIDSISALGKHRGTLSRIHDSCCADDAAVTTAILPRSDDLGYRRFA